MNQINNRIVFSLFALLILAACRSKQADDPVFKEAQTVFEESMAMHDEVMPKMPQVKTRIEDLQQAINRMNIRAMPIDEAQMEALQSTQKSLQDAQDGMMDWMKNVSPLPAKSLKPAELSKLLATQKAQRDRIRAIREQMNIGLAKATEILTQ